MVFISQASNHFLIKKKISCKTNKISNKLNFKFLYFLKMKKIVDFLIILRLF